MAWNDEKHICKMYDKTDNNKSSLKLYMKVRKWYQEWVSKVKTQQMLHEKQSLKGWMIASI